MFDKTMERGMVAAALLAAAVSAQADVFNLPNGQTSLQFVTVGNPGNAPDFSTTGYGEVDYSYQVGKFDVTTAQYTAFRNAVATTSDPYGLYTASMVTVGGSTYGCGITRSGVVGSYSYTIATAYQNFPVNYVSWGDAARFCNWLQNGQPTNGTEGVGTTETTWPHRLSTLATR